MTSAQTVIVIGAGFSGLLTAIHLLESDPHVVVRLVERAGRFGPGRAYAAASPEQLLNVRAANMSAFPDRPDDFVSWLERNGGGADTFVSRCRYGDYLQEILRATLEKGANAGRLLLEHDEAVGLAFEDDDAVVRVAMGREIRGSTVVLALGGGPPPAPADGVGLQSPLYVCDPWAVDLTTIPGGDILLIGSGLTMVDVVLSLDRPDRRFVTLSRRGLLPHAHAPAPRMPAPTGSFESPSAAVGTLRRYARSVGWRAAVDSIRSLTPEIWRGWDLPARRTFLRHVRPWWEVHRHRMAPQIASRIDGLRASGRLEVLAGRLQGLEPIASGLLASIRRRGSRVIETREVAAAVNCTGISGDLAKLPLLADLAQQGLLRADPLGLGLDVDDAFRVIGRDGRPAVRLYAVGPLTRASRWETTAVPDLRDQTQEVAQAVLGARVRRSPC